MPALRALLLMLAALLLTTAPRTVQAQQAASSFQTAYRGELIDADGMPLSGILPLRFELLDESTGAPFWQEMRWVTVHQGRYDLRLGRTMGIPADRLGQSATLRVLLGEQGEITRQRLLLRAWEPAADPATLPRFERHTFADLAGRALRAERASFARGCRTLTGRTPAQIDRSPDLAGRIEELRRQLREEAGAQIRPDHVPSGPAGGTEGARYERICPAGYAATGIRGGGGNFLDSIQLICTQVR
jgi:hypothetical protein